MDVEEKEITVVEEHCKSTLTELNKGAIKSEVQKKTEENKSYMDIQMSQSSGIEFDEKNSNEPLEKQTSNAENDNEDDNKDNKAEDDDELKSESPSVKIFLHDDDEEQNQTPESETENLILLLEEEKTVLTSVSELTEAGDSKLSNDNEENIALELNQASTEVAAVRFSSSQIVDKEELDIDANKNHVAIKENQILKARISEVNEELQSARDEIEKLKKIVALLENEAKNPESMTAQLSAQKAENEDLKQEIVRQNIAIQAAAEKETQLSQQLSSLSAIDEEKSTSIKKKQLEIEKLKAAISDLNNQPASICQEGNKNGLSTLNSRDAFGSNLSDNSRQPKSQRSNICSII